MMKKNFLIGLAGISLALGLMVTACDTGTGTGGSGNGNGNGPTDSGGTVVYTSTATDGRPMVITIWRAAGSANILASAYGAPVYAYVPKSSDTHTIRIAGILVSRGTVSRSGTTMVFLVGGSSSNTFVASLNSTGATLSFSGGTIKTNDGDTITVTPTTTDTPPFIDEPILPTPTPTPTPIPRPTPAPNPPVVEEEPETEPEPELVPITSIESIAAYLGSAEGGVTAANPVPLKLNISIDESNLQALWTALETAEKFVSLYLSDSTFQEDNKTFSPYFATASGENKVVSLTLPADAETIADGTSTTIYTFANFSAIKTVNGAGIKNIGAYAFYNRAALTTAFFPLATDIGTYTFYSCTALTTASIPRHC
jgi:hypothetical protein